MLGHQNFKKHHVVVILPSRVREIGWKNGYTNL